MPHFQVTNVPRGHFFQPATVSCDAEFKICAFARNWNDNYDCNMLVTSCDGGKTWSENPDREDCWTDVKVNADGGLIYATGESNPKAISAFPL